VRPSVRALSIPLNAATAEAELPALPRLATATSPGESASAERPPLLRLVGDDAATARGVEAMNDEESAAFRGINRRKHHRFALVRSSKVFRRASASFVPARTVNLSVGGALIEAAAARPFEVGEIIDLGVAYRGAAAVAQDAMQQAIVVRVQTLDEQRQTVAVRYVNPHHLERRAA
jgi:hypothetical protein